MAQELVVMGEDTAVSLWRKPEQVLAEAKEAAQALIKVVNMKPKKVIFNGETYLEFEDWQTVAKFYGCTTKIVSTNLVEYDGVRGFEATAVVLDRNQNEIGRVDSMCLSDEANWGDVPVYEWKYVLDEKGQKIWVDGKDGKKRPKANKVEVRREPKPLFQLRSMAQTRAQVKALRSIFSWVVVMAGYQPTPAEELTGNEFPEDEREERKPVSMPQSTDKPAAEKPKTEIIGGVIGNRKDGKEGELWLTLGDKLVAVPSAFASLHPFDVGHKMSIIVLKRQGREREFFVLQKVEGYEVVEPQNPPREAYGSIPEDKKKPDAIDEALANGQVAFEDVEKEPIGDLQETRTGVIGRKREIRLQTLMGKNKDKNHNLTWDDMHKILNGMEPPVAHVRDLPAQEWYATFEKIVTGEEDWRELV
jgi:hypothetical protein